MNWALNVAQALLNTSKHYTCKHYCLKHFLYLLYLLYHTSWPLNRGGIADLPLLRTLLAICQKSQEPTFYERMGSFALLAHASLAASRTILQRLLACPNFTLDSEDVYFWYKRKKLFLWTMVAARAAEKHGDELGRFDLILKMRDLYINSNLNPLTKFTSSSRSTEFKDILPGKISQMITKIIPISTNRVINYVMKQGILFCIYWKVNGNWDNMIRIPQ